MEFNLFYRGSLRSNGSPQHKQEIRRALHSQLKQLWELEPLKGSKSSFIGPAEDGHQDINLLEQVGAFTFAPLISSRLALAASLRITLLRPEEPGTIILQSGDIDNRLKTLFDALSVPAHANQLPGGDSPSGDETPLYCLLQDDRLISSVSVDTDRLLEQGVDKNEVVLIIHVRTKVMRHIWAAIPFL
ncbi:MAG: hypothetical protein ED859_18580 [Desulfuromonadales bacterium]|nr:MAG: hypothetical protein ED859_18580 [Desulfuromonadales bacterium]